LDGSSWTYIPGITGNQLCAAVYERDGTGSVLAVGGTGNGFDGVGGWNGLQWIPLGEPGISSGAVYAFTQLTDPTGSYLYAGGLFDSAGGWQARCIAQFDGQHWWPLIGGDTDNNEVDALTVFDDGTGPALYAAGWFHIVGAVVANGIAKYDGTTWSALGIGLNGAGKSLTVFDDGSGPALYVAGEFSTAGGVLTGGLARWNGTHWSRVGSSPFAPPPISLLGTDHGLYIGGQFASVAGCGANLNVTRWGCTCYANCDGSACGQPLSANDFSCFLNKFAAGDPYANCDGSTSEPTLNANDFACFLNKFAAGCS
jgi:hypothetical protein